MAPILGIIASSITGNLVTNSYSSIATVTVGAGGATSIDFTSIPSTYSHLQVRAIMRGTYSGTLVSFFAQINGETGSFYSSHHLGGDGSTPYAYAGSTQTYIELNDIAADTNTASAYSAYVMDILDYASVNKYKTIRGLLGRDFNGSGQLELNSSLYQKTTAVTSIKFYLGANAFKQYSHFALYGIKA
jgi:hypothetical protein